MFTAAKKSIPSSFKSEYEYGQYAWNGADALSIWKCRCGVVVIPVMPTFPTGLPFRILVPGSTETDSRCKYEL